MSFGKKNEQLGMIPTFGGSYVQKAKARARRPAFKGGEGVFHWADNFRPPEHTPAWVRLIAGNYEQETSHDGETIVTEAFPFVAIKEHVSRQGNAIRSSVCSAGPLFLSILSNNNKARPCPSCEIWAEDWRVRKDKKTRGDTTKGPNRMDLKDMFVYNCWDYGLYFEVPNMGASGPRINPHTNKPYTSWVPGNPNDPNMKGMPWKQGHLSPWYLGAAHQEAIVNFACQVVGNMCKSCGTRGSIVAVMKVCGNPQCGRYIYDPHSTTLTNEQRVKIDFEPFTCPYCRQTNYVEEVIECNNPGCSTAERTAIFDIDILVQRVKSGDGRQTSLQILDYSTPRPIQVGDPEALKNIKPLDLLKKFAPTSPESQLTVHNMRPQAAPAASPPTAPQDLSTMPALPYDNDQIPF